MNLLIFYPHYPGRRTEEVWQLQALSGPFRPPGGKLLCPGRALQSPHLTGWGGLDSFSWLTQHWPQLSLKALKCPSLGILVVVNFLNHSSHASSE